MLSLYEEYKAPDIPYVTIYRDDEIPHKFYMVPSQAAIARDDKGEPMFTFILYARDVDKLKPEELEIERGYLAATTQAAVSRDIEDKIRAYLRQMLQNERNNGSHFLFKDGGRFLFKPITNTEPELSYPPLWLDGKAELRVVGSDMVNFSTGTTQPSLMGTNVASFVADLNQTGAELFCQAVKEGKTPFTVWYTLSLAARIPSVSIHIYGNKYEFYEEVRKYVHKSRLVTQERRILGVTIDSHSYFEEWDELSSIEKFRNTFHGIQVEIDDLDLPVSGGEKNEMKEKLESMAMEILKTNVLPTFFEKAIEDVTNEKENPNAKTPDGFTDSINMWFKKSEIVSIPVNPNAELSQMLTLEEIKKNTIYVDLSNPYFQELDVSVNANVNFKDDPVYALVVALDYDQQDDLRNERVHHRKDFSFKEDTPGRFRTIMAKNSDGTPKDTYKYWSQIVYKETGETIRVPSKPGEWLESQERDFKISYKRLGFIKVNLVLGVMPDNVKAAYVNIRYPGYTGPSAKQSFELTREKPTATYFTYTGGIAEPGPYFYQISYLLTDGQRMDLKEDSSQAGILIISNPFEESFATRFFARGDFNNDVEKIIIDATYRDDTNDFSTSHHAELMANGETSSWVTGIRNPFLLEFDYNEIIVYKKGSSKTNQKKGQLGQSYEVGIGNSDGIEVTIVSSLIDWEKYKLVLLNLKYDDEANDVHAIKDLIFRKENIADQVWTVPIRDKNKRTFSYNLRFIAADPSNSREEKIPSFNDTLLVIQ